MHHTTAPVVMVAANVRHMACSTARSNPPSLIRLAPVQSHLYDHRGVVLVRSSQGVAKIPHPLHRRPQRVQFGQNFGCRLIAKRLLLAA